MTEDIQSSGSDSFLERLRTEVEIWKSEGLLRPEQAELLLARYGLVPGETARSLQRSRLVSVFAALGAILIGVGIILLIGANWECIPKLGRLAILIVATFGIYHMGYRMTQGDRYPKVGMALLLLGSLLWGGSIFLIGQMYHGGGEHGEITAVGCWFLGVLPLAYVLRSPLHLGLSLVIGTIWFLMTVSYASYFEPAVIFPLILALGVLLYAVGQFHFRSERWKRLELAYRWFGLGYILAALYAFSFRIYWWSHEDMSGLWAFCVWLGIIGGAALLAILAKAYVSDRRDRVAMLEAGALVILLIAAVGFVNSVFSAALAESESPIWAAVLFNLLLLAAETGVIALGWRRNQPGLVNLGILVFFIHVVTRYFDLLSGMLSGGLMFIGAGLLLIFGGMALERSRRKLVDAIRQREVAT